MDPFSIRFAEEDDQKYLIEWLSQPGVLDGFPLADLREIEDAVRICFSYCKSQGVLTALWDNVPCGFANLYLQPYKKLAHQCLFMIVIDEKFRGRGIGKRLLEELMALAKERHQIELLHLEVYENNLVAIRLYERLGFTQYGFQRHFVKDAPDHYLGKILMQKAL
jgi:ribosomal protein S18 acetylase RimI-like enzyme